MPARTSRTPLPKPPFTFDDCEALIHEVIKDGLFLTWFERSSWFLETDLVATLVREERDPNDRGERVIAARECLRLIAKQSHADPMPLLVLLGAARGHGVLKARYEDREQKAMKLLGRKDKRHFRYTTRPKWEREVALELYRELTGDDS